MGWKYNLFEKSLFLQKKVAKNFGMRLSVAPANCITTSSMNYDAVSGTIKDEFEEYDDYCRYRSFELAAEEIHRRYSSQEISTFSTAEAGVNKGDFAWIINRYFPDSTLYLYDTFEGFDKDEIRYEIEHSYTDANYMAELKNAFGVSAFSAQERMQLVSKLMKYPEKCEFRKGLFPETAVNEKDKKWIFVSLDMDLYLPILEGIIFFYPNLIPGGYIFVHDYNNNGFAGIKKALSEAESKLGVAIPRVSIPDEGGTVILTKV